MRASKLGIEIDDIKIVSLTVATSVAGPMSRKTPECCVHTDGFMRRIELGQNIKVKRENLVKTPIARSLGERAWQEEQFWLQYFIEDHGQFPTPTLFCRRCRPPAV